MRLMRKNIEPNCFYGDTEHPRSVAIRTFREPSRKIKRHPDQYILLLFYSRRLFSLLAARLEIFHKPVHGLLDGCAKEERQEKKSGVRSHNLHLVPLGPTRFLLLSLFPLLTLIEGRELEVGQQLHQLGVASRLLVLAIGTAGVELFTL